MNKILKLLVDDYLPRKASAEYLLALSKFCDAERKFMDSLSVAQKKEYLQLDFIKGELDILEQDELAEYLFEDIRRHM